MSCLNLKRLLPPRKVWKVFTNKLAIKLSRSNANKKQKNRSYKNSKKLGWPSLSIQPKKFKNKTKLIHTSIQRKNHQYYFQKRLPPVFIDQLFVEPVSVVKEPVLAAAGASKEKSCSLGSSLKKSEILDQKSGQPEACKEEKSVAVDDHNMYTADDVWESMVLASPQMHGINERAEEFIARFRAEMHHQEMLARRL